MTTIITNIGTEINGVWSYLSVVNNEVVLTDASDEIISQDASESLWYFTTEQLDQFEMTTGFELEV